MTNAYYRTKPDQKIIDEAAAELSSNSPVQPAGAAGGAGRGAGVGRGRGRGGKKKK